MTCPQIRPKSQNFLNLTSHTLFTIFETYNPICKEYSKFIEKLVEFVNDLSITCSIRSTQVFDWYLNRIQYKKNCLFFKKSLIPLSSLSITYITKLIVIVVTNISIKSHCRITQGLQPNSIYREKHPLGVFKNTLTRSQKRPAMAAIIHKNVTLIIFFTSKESLSTANLLRHT